ncbi:MAG: 4Fe-4S cluster-binding domain-containing protein [Ruminococcus flavefaciens]|nr:4Fe-4S cluster-binding domain-containing protein [Ruminococcus flavefaciens]
MNYWKIDKEDVCNGEGLRVVLWLSGCSHHCYNCQNPQTWDKNSGIPFDESAKEELFRELDKDYISGLTLTGGDPLFESNLDDVIDLVTEVNKRYNTPQYIDNVNGNNHNILANNADEFRLSCPQKSIWLYTGYNMVGIKNNFCLVEPNIVTEKILESNKLLTSIDNLIKCSKIISMCDVLVDGQYIDSQRDITLPYRGSKNQRLIDIQKSLQKGETILWEA